MTYYQESQFLDLRKKYNAFSYTKLVDKQGDTDQAQQGGKYNPKGME